MNECYILKCQLWSEDKVFCMDRNLTKFILLIFILFCQLLLSFQSGIPISLRMFKVSCDPHKSFSVVNEAEVDVFLEFPFFFF